jgi:hypothetical protein
VFDGEQDDKLSTYIAPELSLFAERHGLNFISGDVNPYGDISQAEAESSAFLEDLHEREVAQTPTMRKIMEHASGVNYQHCGINE